MLILVVDDHPLIRTALAEALRALDSPVWVIEARSGTEALACVDENPALDLVLLDLGLPDCNGLSALRTMRAAHPTIPVVVFSATDDFETVTAAIRAGAMGFIPKTSTNASLVNAIKLVLAGDVYLPPCVLAANSPEANSFRHSTQDKAQVLHRMTIQQKRVLRHLLGGSSNKEIARELEKVNGRPIEVATVKAHVSAILNLLDVSSRTHAVVRAGILGIATRDLQDPLDLPAHDSIPAPDSETE